jgi:PAT family beta-lactamase induction signal transducer AmpG
LGPKEGKGFVNRFFISFIISINSGLGLALLTSIFTTYLRDNQIDLVTIGILSLRMTPYSLKYFWAPFVENSRISIFKNSFGQRKSWLLTCQFLLFISIITIGFIDVKNHLFLFCFMAFVVSFLSATYDIAMEAFRIELFKKQDLNRGILHNILGFRFGLLCTAAGGIYLSLLLPWNVVYLIIAMLIIPCMLIIYHSEDKRKIKDDFISPKNFREWLNKMFLIPFSLLARKKHFTIMFIIILFYKLSDGYIDAMLIPFLMDIGHSKSEIASITKVLGMIFAVAGTFFGSYIISKFKLLTNLLVAEFFAAISNLLFIILIHFSPNLKLLTLVISIENFCSGVCNILLIQYMSSLCSKKFTAIHFAILISVSGMAKTILSSLSGWVAITYGWNDFFLISSFLSLPSIICMLLLIKYKSKKL